MMLGWRSTPKVDALGDNGVENAIRPFVVGRKSCLFSASVKGVKASANLYSLIETARANGLEPYAYLRHLFTNFLKVETVEAIEVYCPKHDKAQAASLPPGFTG